MNDVGLNFKSLFIIPKDKLDHKWLKSSVRKQLPLFHKNQTSKMLGKNRAEYSYE